MPLLMNRTFAAGLSLLLGVSPVGAMGGVAFAQVSTDGFSSLNQLFQSKAKTANDEAVAAAEAGREAQREQRRLREEQRLLEAQRARVLLQQVTPSGATDAPPCPGCVLVTPVPTDEDDDKD